MSKFTENIYQFIIKFKYVVLLFVLLFTAYSYTGLAKLELALGPKVWFPKDSPILKELDQFARLFGNDETIVIALHSKNGIFQKDTLQKINDISEEFWKVTDVIRVESILNYNHSYTDEEEDIVIDPLIPDLETITDEVIREKKQIALSKDEIVGRLISKDGHTSLIFAHIKPYFGSKEPNYKIIDKEVKKIIKNYESDEIDVYVSGTIAITAEGRTVVIKDIEKLGPLSLLLIVILLIVYFRTYIGLIIPLCVITGTLLCTFGLTGHFGLKFNSLTFITPLSIMAIAIADSIHFIATYYRMRKDYSKEEALNKSFHKNFYPTLLTSITTAIGFFSLLTADLLTIKTLGIISGMGTMLAWTITVLILPPLVHIFARDKNTIRSFQLNKRLIEGIVGKIVNHNKYFITAFAILLMGSIYLTATSKVNYNFFRSFKDDVQVTKANQFLLDNFGGVLGPELVVDSGKANGINNPEFLKKVEALQKWVVTLPEVNNASSIVDVIKKMNAVISGDEKSNYKIPENKKTVAESIFLYTLGLPQGANINHLVSHDQSKIRMNVLWTIQSALESKVRTDQIESKAKELGLNAYVTGRVKLFQTINDTIVRSLGTSMSMAIILITIFIIVFLRSISIGILSLVPNITPLLIGIAYLKLSGQDVDSGVVVVLSVCLGIAVDDTLHFLNHFLDGQKKNLSLKENFINVLHGTGNSLIITTVILCIGFGVFAFSDYVPNSNFGILSAIILVCALLFDLILLPSFVMATKRFYTVKEPTKNQVET